MLMILLGILLGIVILIVARRCSYTPETFDPTSGDRPMIWFHHVHKAGGTSLVKLAKENGEKLYYKQVHNGLPGNEISSGEAPDFIPFGKMNKRKQEEFIKDARENKTTFIATEFEYPHPDKKFSDSKIVNVIMVRDPVDKLISHIAHLLREPETTRVDYENTTKEDIVKNNVPFFGDVMTKVLAGHAFDSDVQLTDADYKTALKNLQKFDIILVLEDPQSLLKMQKVGWTNFNLPNENVADVRDIETNATVDTKAQTKKILKDWLGSNYREIMRKKYTSLDQKLYNFGYNKSSKGYR